MRPNPIRFLAISLLTLALPLFSAPQTFPFTHAASRLLGQTTFNYSAANQGGTASATTLNWPAGVASAPSGRLFVADYKNNRILSWPSSTAFTYNQPADLVLGKPDFTTVGTDPDIDGCQTPSAAYISGPESVAVDTQGNLYVADTYCHRVLIFVPPFTNGMNASRVLGQPDFGTGTGCVGPSNGLKYCYARGVSVDASGNLFVADEYNHRVLAYTSPLTTDVTPDHVYGQGDSFTTNSANYSGINAYGLNGPRATALDNAGRLYIADLDNNRVLVYLDPLTTNTTADYVFGQAGSFFTNDANHGGISADSLSAPVDLVVHADGDVFISDVGNQRILAYRAPFNVTPNFTADAVLGQDDSFTSSTANLNGRSNDTLYDPLGLAFNSTNTLFVADGQNHRLLALDVPTPLLGTNLILNGDAEGTRGSPDGTTYTPGAWAIMQGEFTAVTYGASGGFPTTTDPGPASRGNNFFGGGNSQPVALTTADQRVDVSALASAIDAGQINFAAAGYFGGWDNQDDLAYLEINFQDESGYLISQAYLGGFNAAYRNNVTGLFPDSESGTVPTGTRRIQIVLSMTYTGGTFTDGYADNLSLTLATATPPQTIVYLPSISYNAGQ